MQSKNNFTYEPTVGVRILESEQDVSSRGAKLAVELWDASGNIAKYEPTWPALMKDVAGVILVYNADNRAHEHEAAQWFEWFVTNNQLEESQCLILAHSLAGKSFGTKRLAIPKAFRIINSSVQSPELIHEEFLAFLQGLSRVTSSRK